MSSPVPASSQEQQFLQTLQDALATQQFERLILSQYQGEQEALQKITFRLLTLQGQHKLSGLYHYRTQDVTKNYSPEQGLVEIEQLLAQCKQANLFMTGEELQLKKNKKKVLLNRTHQQNAAQAVSIRSGHDRDKQRYVDQQQPFLKYLGITDDNAQVIPSMARKWKQINKFIEIFSGALSQINTGEQLRIVDFGSGKGYLTFALYDYLIQHQQQPYITGVELRPNLVEFCQKVAQQSGFNQLDFFQGDVRSYHPEQLDVMIALHACDVATDFAIHTGIRLKASMIMCAPCCHKELRPQLQSPEVLKPMLYYGIHAGQQAEMLTDSIRALLLKAYRYDTKVFEFVALEHTSKNKMILATRRKEVSQPDPQILEQIRALKALYGIERHSLELLLNDQWEQQDMGCKC